MNQGLAIFGVMVGTIIAFTILGGGKLNLGTSPSGPYINFGFAGPQNRG